MDTKKECRIPEYGSLVNLRNQKVVVGAKQLRKAFLKNTVRWVFLAENADPAITEPVAVQCKENSVPHTWIPTMADLGRACGIEVGAAAAAVID